MVFLERKLIGLLLEFLFKLNEKDWSIKSCIKFLKQKKNYKLKIVSSTPLSQKIQKHIKYILNPIKVIFQTFPLVCTII